MAGISKSTVSRAINTPHLVRRETLQRIQKVMDERHYVYDAIAGELSSKKNAPALGLITPTIRVPAFAEMASAIQEKAQERGYSIIFANSQYNLETETELLNLFLQRRVSGIILTGSSNKKKLAKFLTDRRIPYVFVWETIDDASISFIGYDNFKSSYDMTEYLINLNHERIGLITGPSLRIERIKQRLDGYIATLKNYHIAYDPSMVVVRNDTHLDGKDAARKLLAQSRPPTAIAVAASPLVAIGALAGIKDKGLKVPEDISIIALGDIEYAADCDPPLTTMRIPALQMGGLAVTVLLDMIEQGQTDSRQYCLDTDLIIRKSCCACRSK
jgi:DNA-binding LacI/PurR family transcriptional regulator